MNYYKFTYYGRDSMGCNNYRYHTLITPGEDEKEAVKMLVSKVKERNRNSSWPHQLINISDFEMSNEIEYLSQERHVNEQKEKAKKIEKLNAFLKSQ